MHMKLEDIIHGLESKICREMAYLYEDVNDKGDKVYFLVKNHKVIYVCTDPEKAKLMAQAYKDDSTYMCALTSGGGGHYMTLYGSLKDNNLGFFTNTFDDIGDGYIELHFPDGIGRIIDKDTFIENLKYLPKAWLKEALKDLKGKHNKKYEGA